MPARIAARALQIPDVPQLVQPASAYKLPVPHAAREILRPIYPFLRLVK